MRAQVVPGLALLAGAAAAAVDVVSSCGPGLSIIVARGTSELKGTGITGSLARRIADRIKGSTVTAVDYPATITNPEYDESVGDGVEALQGLVNKHIKACPDSKLALLGYSQGAQLIMDAVCGRTGAAFEDHPNLPSGLVKKNIVAMVLFGDPSHVVGASYDKGTSVNNGIFDRDNSTVAACEKLSDRLVSYCDEGDTYCDAGSDRTVHSGYIGRYSDDALKFVVDGYAKAVGSNGSSTGSSTGTSTGASCTGASITSAGPSIRTGVGVSHSVCSSSAGNRTVTASSTGTVPSTPTASSTGSAPASSGSAATTPAGGAQSAASRLAAGASVHLGLLVLAAAVLRAL